MSARLRAPGWYRAALFIVLGIAFSYALSIGARAALVYDPVLDGDAPHRQRGCDAQAWAVTEALRVWKWLGHSVRL